MPLFSGKNPAIPKIMRDKTTRLTLPHIKSVTTRSKVDGMRKTKVDEK